MNPLFICIIWCLLSLSYSVDVPCNETRISGTQSVYVSTGGAPAFDLRTTGNMEVGDAVIIKKDGSILGIQVYKSASLSIDSIKVWQDKADVLIRATPITQLASFQGWIKICFDAAIPVYAGATLMTTYTARQSLQYLPTNVTISLLREELDLTRPDPPGRYNLNPNGYEWAPIDRWHGTDIIFQAGQQKLASAPPSVLTSTQAGFADQALLIYSLTGVAVVCIICSVALIMCVIHRRGRRTQRAVLERRRSHSSNGSRAMSRNVSRAVSTRPSRRALGYQSGTVSKASVTRSQMHAPSAYQTQCVGGDVPMTPLRQYASMPTEYINFPSAMYASAREGAGQSQSLYAAPPAPPAAQHEPPYAMWRDVSVGGSSDTHSTYQNLPIVRT